MYPVICPDLPGLFSMLREGAAAALIAQEAFSRNGLAEISAWLSTQPPWSDMPFVVLTSGGRPSRITVTQAQEHGAKIVGINLNGFVISTW